MGSFGRQLTSLTGAKKVVSKKMRKTDLYFKNAWVAPPFMTTKWMKMEGYSNRYTYLVVGKSYILKTLGHKFIFNMTWRRIFCGILVYKSISSFLTWLGDVFSVGYLSINLFYKSPLKLIRSAETKWQPESCLRLQAKELDKIRCILPLEI